MKAPVLYIVIPCYNEEEALPITAERLTGLTDDMLNKGLIDEKTDTVRKTPVRLTPAERRSLLLILGSVLFIYMGYNGFHTHYTNYLVK